MPQLDTYYSLKNAYGTSEHFTETVENFVPTRSMKFNSSWSGKGSPPPSPTHHPRPNPPNYYDDGDYERHRRRRFPPYYNDMYYPPLPPNYSYLQCVLVYSI